MGPRNSTSRDVVTTFKSLKDLDRTFETFGEIFSDVERVERHVAWITSVSGCKTPASICDHLFHLVRLVQMESERNMRNRPLRDELAGPVQQRLRRLARQYKKQAKKIMFHQRTQRHLASIGRQLTAKDFVNVSKAAGDTLVAICEKVRTSQAALTVHEAELYERALLHRLRDHWAMQRSHIWTRPLLGSTFQKERQSPPSLRGEAANTNEGTLSSLSLFCPVSFCIFRPCFVLFHPLVLLSLPTR